MRGIICGIGNNLKLVVDMKILMDNVKSKAVFSCTQEHDISKWTMEKVFDMYPNIYYKFVLPENQGNQGSYNDNNWNYYLN